MKYYVSANQCAFVLKNGKFIKVVDSGKYYFPKSLGYKIYIEEMQGNVNYNSLPYDILAKDELFKNSTIRIQIPDGYLGLLYINGSLKGCLDRTEYIFWNVFETVTYTLISMNELEMSEDITKHTLSFIPTKYYSKVCVNEGDVGLLYLNNKLGKELSTGTYTFWNYNKDISCKVVDMKLKELNIVGQEILTADKIGIRLNVSCSYQITDASGIISKIHNLDNQLYSYCQLAIRELVGNYRLDEILEQKTTISKDIFEKLCENSSTYFVSFTSAGIKDIVLPGEIKDIMNTVLVAEKTAQANVISRREEVASTRSLLNTARLMDENKTLYKLKELEYMEKICKQVGNISLSGNSNLIGQLNELLGAR